MTGHDRGAVGFALGFILPLLVTTGAVLLLLRRRGFPPARVAMDGAPSPGVPSPPARSAPGPASPAAAVLRLDAELRAGLPASGLLPPGADPLDEHLVLVHNGLSGHDVIVLFIVWLPDDEPRVVPPEGLTARQLFAALDAGLPPRRRFRKLGELAVPVPADVYVAPEPLGAVGLHSS